MSEKDGGAAFPVVRSTPFGESVMDYGMSLRDYFAAQALVLFLSPEALAAVKDEISRHGLSPEAGFAKAAYEVADAMLAERAKS